MKRKENFQWLPKELHQLKYEAISVPQGSVRLVKKTQERKSSTCYLLITKGVTSSSPVPLKTRRERERENTMANEFWVSVRNNILKKWNTTENDVSKNQSSADSAIRLPNTSILNSNAADITEYFLDVPNYIILNIL
ncbi:uncharacterized protein TNCV_2927531 [Trichonephila clavipes]|nr:uncharacterized protein TNCV_2927531 [Trichonephila clavipes]